MSEEVVVTEGWHTLEDGTKLYTKTWKPPSTTETKAKLVFLHGYSHYCDLYADFFVLLAQRNIEVFCFDQRGWGHSVTTPSSRGNTGPTTQIMDDYTSILTSYFSSSSDTNPATTSTPTFLMGHSMGGTNALTYASLGPPEILRHFRGLLLSSPDFGFPPNAPAKPPWFVVSVVRLVKMVAPKMQVTGKLDPTTLSRDEDVGRRYLADELSHDTGTLEWVLGHFERVERAAGGIVMVDGDVVGSVWVGHGTEDLCTSFEKSRRWCGEVCTVEDREFREYKGWRHNLHQEPGEDKVIFADDVAAWILKRSEKSS